MRTLTNNSKLPHLAVQRLRGCPIGGSHESGSLMTIDVLEALRLRRQDHYFAPEAQLHGDPLGFRMSGLLAVA
jgi:hypothetical protein